MIERLFLLAPLICSPLFAQSPHFEAASVHISQPGQPSAEFHTRPGYLMVRNFPLHGCIEWAYNLRPLQIEGPS